METREMKVAKMNEIAQVIASSYPRVMVATTAYLNRLEICVHALKKEAEFNNLNLQPKLKEILGEEYELRYRVMCYANRFLKIEF